MIALVAAHPFLFFALVLIAVAACVVSALMLAALADETACTGDCNQGRTCDCVPKIGYPTEEEA